MEANIVIETNLVLDDKQNAEIQSILRNGYHIFSVIYCTKMLIKLHQIHTGSSKMHALFSIAISRLCIKHNKSYWS